MPSNAVHDVSRLDDAVCDASGVHFVDESADAPYVVHLLVGFGHGVALDAPRGESSERVVVELSKVVEDAEGGHREGDRLCGA